MKKIMAVIAAAAVALTLVGCAGEDGINWPSYTKDKQNKIGFYAQVAPNTTLDGTWYIPDTVFYAGDDTEGAIKGNNDNYSINHENKTDGKYRAYKETAFKHAGALVKVTFNTANTSSSKMGVIFDLKKSANEGADDFYAIAVGQEGGGTYYVSKFTNVTDIQADNFGTKLTTNPAIEKEIVPIKTGNLSSKMPKAVEGKTSVCIYFKLAADGSFDWALLDLTDDEMKDFKGAKKFLEANIDDYKVLVKGNTKAVAGAEYEEAPVEQTSLF
jgi:hypothetical protein